MIQFQQNKKIKMHFDWSAFFQLILSRLKCSKKENSECPRVRDIHSH